MKHLNSFCTDKKLRINSWGEKIAELTGKPSSTVLGKKYYEVLPRIFTNKDDAVYMALRKNRAITLKGYCFNCLYGTIEADIKIEPLKTVNEKAGKVKVSFYPYAPCPMVKKLQSSQRLIDIGKTASTLAHGVRNPLNAIKGAVVYLREKYSNEATLTEFTQIIEEEISRLDNFISKFLSTSVSAAVLSEIDVNLLLRKIEKFTSLQAHAHNISSIYEYGDIPLISIDFFQLEQAVLNVINNAIEAMPSGGQLTIKTQSKNRFANNFVVIEISDTGPGMAESKVNGQSILLKDEGKGFGLFLTREIIQHYRGHLEIRSKKGVGTTVRLYLPAK